MPDASDFESKTSKALVNMQRFQTILNGGITTTVTVDGGLVIPSVAKTLHDLAGNVIPGDPDASAEVLTRLGAIEENYVNRDHASYPFTTDMNMGGMHIYNLANPVGDNDATPRDWVLGQITTSVGALSTTLEASIASVATSVTGLSGNLTPRVAALENANFGSAISTVSTGLGALTTRVTAAETAATALTTRVGATETAATALTTRVTAAETAAGTLTTRVTAAEGSIRSEASAQEAVDAALGTVYISPRRQVSFFNSKVPATYMRSFLAESTLTTQAKVRDYLSVPSVLDFTNLTARVTSTETAAGTLADRVDDAEAKVQATYATMVQDQGTPGDAPLRFTTSLTGPAAGAADLDPTWLVQTAAGPAVRIVGSGYVAARARYKLLPDRIYRITWYTLRLADPSDSTGDAIDLRANWLSGDQTVQIQRSTYQTYPALTVANGLQRFSRTFSLTGADADQAWPSGAQYVVPFTQTSGLNGQTAIVGLIFEDITDQAALLRAIDIGGGNATALFEAERDARITAVNTVAEARAVGDALLNDRVDATDSLVSIQRVDIDTAKRRADQNSLYGPDAEVEDYTTIATRSGNGILWINDKGALQTIGGEDLSRQEDDERDFRWALESGGLASFWWNRDDGTVGGVFDDYTKAQFGGAVAARDLPQNLFQRDAFGGARMSGTLERALSNDEGQTYAYVYRRDQVPMAAIREGREPMELFGSLGQSLRVGGGANGTIPHLLTTTALRPHLNFMLDAGMRGPGTIPWNPSTATDFAPAIEAYNSSKNEGETGMASFMRYLSLRQIATGRTQWPLFGRVDGQGGQPLLTFVKGTVPYANLMASLRRAAEISCGIYGRPVVSRAVLFGVGNADRAASTAAGVDTAAYVATWVTNLVQLAADLDADIRALVAEFAGLYPSLYEGVTLPTRVVMLTPQLTDAINPTGDTADGILYAHVTAAAASSLIKITYPQYNHRDDWGYIGGSDQAHLKALGSMVTGEFDALAYEQVVWNGADQGALFPVVSGVTRSGGNLIVPTIGGSGALRVDTDGLPLAAGWGFNWSGTGSVTGISFSGSNIILAGTTGTGTLTYGAKHQAVAAPSGSYAYGNVCDSTTLESVAVPGLILTNRLLAFTATLA